MGKECFWLYFYFKNKFFLTIHFATKLGERTLYYASTFE
jgi:hypothetical protein